MDFKHFSFLEQNIKKQKGGVIPLLGVSLIIFIVTVAVYFVANYVSEGIARQGELSGWEYLYTDKAGVLPDADLRVYSAQNPIVTESSVRRDNIYFVKTLEPEDDNRTLIIRTDHSPVMIRVNGREVYNNMFQDSAYVGNCYNAVTIGASSRQQVVEVFMKLPFSVRFEAELSHGEHSAFSPTAGFFAGGVLTVLGIVSLAVLAILGIVNRRCFRALGAAGVLAYCGAAVMIYNLPEVSYFVNPPIWVNIVAAVTHTTMMLGLLLIIGWFSRLRKLLVGAFFALGIGLLLVMFAVDPILIYISNAAMGLLTAAAVGYAGYTAIDYVLRRTRYATAIFVILVYYFLMTILASVLFLLRSTSLYIYTVIIPTLVVCGVIAYIYYVMFRFERRNAELYNQSKRYGNSVENISRFIRSMLTCSDREAFYETAVNEISQLVILFNERNKDLCCCVGVREGDSFTEKLNCGVSGCRYDIIERNSVVNRRNCIFSDTYFEYLLEKDVKKQVIFHFENIVGGLDVFFDSMVEAAYCGLETSYENTFGTSTRSVDLILGELAENAELNNGYSLDHLSHICTLTLRFCRAMGMDEEQAQSMSVAAKLHDLGKIAIPLSIINKDGRLTEEEQVIVASHTEFGYLILSAYDEPLLKQAAEIARYHHEHYDGTGQNGLADEKIPLSARIVSICDVFDALISERSYKKPWSKERSLAFIKDNAGKLFDPELVKIFVSQVAD